MTISKYTGEKNNNASSHNFSKIATYINANNDSSIVGLSSADMILEFLSSSSGITYKAIFNEASAKNVDRTINLKEYFNSLIPKLNSMDNIDMDDIKGKKATSIFITFNEDSSSNFLYQDGEYSHFRGLYIDKDKNIPVKVSNVIVQFIEGNIINDETITSSKNHGNGLLFSGGKAQDIKWSRKKDSEVNFTDSNGEIISLMPGSTWWIFINKDCSVAYD